MHLWCWDEQYRLCSIRVRHEDTFLPWSFCNIVLEWGTNTGEGSNLCGASRWDGSLQQGEREGGPTTKAGEKARKDKGDRSASPRCHHWSLWSGCSDTLLDGLQHSLFVKRTQSFWACGAELHSNLAALPVGLRLNVHRSLAQCCAPLPSEKHPGSSSFTIGFVLLCGRKEMSGKAQHSQFTALFPRPDLYTAELMCSWGLVFMDVKDFGIMDLIKKPEWNAQPWLQSWISFKG